MIECHHREEGKSAHQACKTSSQINLSFLYKYIENTVCSYMYIFNVIIDYCKQLGKTVCDRDFRWLVGGDIFRPTVSSYDFWALERCLYVWANQYVFCPILLWKVSDQCDPAVPSCQALSLCCVPAAGPQQWWCWKIGCGAVHSAPLLQHSDKRLFC